MAKNEDGATISEEVSMDSRDVLRVLATLLLVLALKGGFWKPALANNTSRGFSKAFLRPLEKIR